MSESAPNSHTFKTVDGGRVAILKSKWHAELVDTMCARCEKILLDHGVDKVDVWEFPGTLEFPLGIQILNDSRSYDAYICLSVVEKGATAHFDMIIHSTTKTLQEISLNLHCPIINEIIAVYDSSDAVARASDDEYNKGIEAAGATLDMLAIMQYFG